MHQDQYTRQKVPPLTENTQDDMRTEQSGNLPVPSVFPQGNNHDQPNTFRQPSSRTQNGNPPPLSNEHNLPNSQFPNHSPECCRFQGSLPWQYPPGWSHHSSLSQNITSPSSPVNTNESFNDRDRIDPHTETKLAEMSEVTMSLVNPHAPSPRERPPQQSSFHETPTGSGSCEDLAVIPEEDPVYDDGTSTSRNPEKENEVNHATTRGLSVRTPKSIPGNNLHRPPVQSRSLPRAEELQPIHAIISNHHPDDPSLAPQPQDLYPDPVSASSASLQSVVTEPERPDRVGLRGLMKRSKNRKPHPNPNGGSFRSYPSKTWPVTPKSIKSFFTGSKQSLTPYRSEILLPFPNDRIPIYSGGKLDDIVDAYMNAKIELQYGLEPKFHPLWDPNFTHFRTNGHSMPPVHRIKVFDVGHFDTGGRFVPLFNLRLSKEENEDSLGFKFKKIHFVPLAIPKPKDPITLRDRDMTLYPEVIQVDHAPVHNPGADERHFKLILGKELRAGAVIAVLGELLHYSSSLKHNLMQIAEEFAFDEYFTTQSIEWCRHARYDRKRLVGNGELVLISDTYEAAGWGKLAYRTTMKGGANKQNPSISFCQDPRDGSYRKKYDFHRCDAAVYQRAPAISAVDQCIGFRGYVIKCPREAWSSM